MAEPQAVRRREAPLGGAPARRPPRLLVPTERADLRVTWHRGDDRFVLSLWHGDACVGTAPLTAADAAEVAAFVTSRLGERTRWVPGLVPTADADRAGPPAPAAPAGEPALVRAWRRLRARSR